MKLETEIIDDETTTMIMIMYTRGRQPFWPVARVNVARVNPEI